jgi:hypothetical protein
VRPDWWIRVADSYVPANPSRRGIDTVKIIDVIRMDRARVVNTDIDRCTPVVTTSVDAAVGLLNAVGEGMLPWLSKQYADDLRDSSGRKKPAVSPHSAFMGLWYSELASLWFVAIPEGMLGGRLLHFEVPLVVVSGCLRAAGIEPAVIVKQRKGKRRGRPDLVPERELLAAMATLIDRGEQPTIGGVCKTMRRSAPWMKKANPSLYAMIKDMCAEKRRAWIRGLRKGKYNNRTGQTEAIDAPDDTE